MGLKPLYPNRWLGAKRELNPIDCIELCIWKQQPEPCRVRTVVPSQRPRYFLAAVSLGAVAALSLGAAASLLMLSFFGAESLAMLSFFGAASLAMLSFAAASFAAFSFCAFFLALRCSCFDALSEVAEASFFASLFAAGAVAGAGVAGAGVCAAAVSETANAPAISANINLFMNTSSVSLWKR